MSDRDMGKAHPALARQIEQLQAFMTLIGHPVFVTDVWRSADEQGRLWAQGRDDQGNVVDPARVVTWARPGSSKHEHLNAEGKPCSLAVDLAFCGQQPWGEDHPWGVLAMAAQELFGLNSIAIWSKERDRFVGDRPHLELR